MMADIGVSWPRAVFTCLTVLSLYIGGCQAAVGDACPIGNECTVTGETCSGGACVCDTTTHYQSGSVCVTKVAVGVNCTGLPPDACSTNSACVGNICTCNSGFYDSDGPGSAGTCVSPPGVNCTVLPADACSTNSACVGNICTCNSGSYDSDGAGSAGTCVSQIALSGICDNSLGVTVIQCSTVGAVCGTDNKCRCGTGKFDDNGFNTTGGVCQDMSFLMVTAVTSTDLGITSVTISWTAPVTYSGQVSRYDVTWTSTQGGGTGTQSASTATSVEVTGLQSATQYSFTVNTIELGSQTSEQQVSSPALAITTKSQLGDNCGDCADSNAICSSIGSTTCVCNTGYYDNNGDSAGGTCIQIINAGEGTCYNIANECTANSACSGVGGTCVCNSGFYDNGATCASIINAGEGTCNGIANECTANSDCSSGTCVCSSEYYDSGTTCESKIALSVSCNSALTGVSQCSDVNAECTSTGGDACRCMAGYFDSNGFSSTGGTCTAMSTLKVTGVTVTAGTDTVSVTWTPPTEASQVNKYQVMWSPPKTDGSTSFDAGTALTATISGFTSGATYIFSLKTVESGSRPTTQEIESDSRLTVSMKAALSVTCGTGSPVVECADTTTASCILNNSPSTNVCRCNDKFFDSNGFGSSGGVCTPMSNLKVTAVSSSSVTTTGVTISWTAPQLSSQVSSYTVVWSDSNSETGTYPAGNATGAVITGLTQRTTYVFKVKSLETGSRSTTQEIESDSSDTVTTKAELSQMCDGSFLCGNPMSECIAADNGGNVCRCKSGYYDSNGYSTAGGVCTDITGLIVTSLTVGVEGTSTVAIQWAGPSLGSDQVNRYEVHWTPVLSNGTGSFSAAKATSVRLTGFVSGQQYTFYVKSIETGSRANQQEVQTVNNTITINAGLSVNCDGNIQCADSNAACIQAADGSNNVCRCNSMFFDSNGYSTPGGMCIAMSTLAVTGLTLTKEGTDTVNISWTAPSQYTDQVNRYEVHWTPSTTINGNTFYNALFTTAVQLVGFIPGQTYTFYVRSLETGSRSMEQYYDTTTPLTTMKPSTPSGFTATDVDGPQITLFWSLPSGIRTSYDVTTTPVLSPYTTSTESITYTVNVLDGQRYNISITTVSGSERSDPLLATFRTVSKTPDPPTGVVCNVFTDKTITLTWTAPVSPRGDIQHYVVNSITTNAMFPTSTSQTEYMVDGLQPETSYTFSVATVNDAVMPHSKQSQYSSQAGCPTKAAMSLEPSTLVVSQVQSRQFTLNWTKPTITNGPLRGYRLRVLDGSMCVQEVIFTCNSCTGYMAFSFICHEEVRQTVTILPTDLDSYTYTVGNLLPYINYTASVVAVNAAGDGHPNTQYVMTDQEVPQHPTTLTATVVSSTEINVNWDISDPKPGPTTYTLYIIAVAPESSRTQTIPGFSVRSYKVVGLQEYRTYTFNLTASTVKGLAVFQQTLPSAKTLAAAPGAVSNFMVARLDGPNYTTVRVSWELPAVLERNSDIVKFMFTHNTTGGNLNAVPEEVPIDTNLNTVIRNLAVLPHNTYYIEVYAVGTNSNGDVYNGIKSINTYMAPAGLAALSEVCGIGSAPVECQDVVTASCTASNTQGVTVCRCNLGHFDSNGYDIPGGTCVSMSTLRVSGVTSSGAVDTSTATISWVPPPDQSHVSRYTVVWRVSGSTAIDGSFNAGKSKYMYASITGLEHDTTYVFTVKTVETGSRIEPQDIESDASVTITTNTSITPWVAVFVVTLVLSILFFVAAVYFWNRSRRTEGKATDESHYETPSRVYNNSDMHLYNLTADERQMIQNEKSQTEDYKNVNIYDTAP